MDKGREKHADFTVRLVGQGISPSVIPVRALARILGALQRLVDQRDDDTTEISQVECEQEQPAARPLHLVGIKTSSAGYLVAAPDRKCAVDILRNTGHAIAEPRRSEWNGPTLSALKELSEVARAIPCEIEIRNGRVLATVTPRTYEEISPSAFVYGRTSLYARIERVGGATEMHCGIRLPEMPRKMVICHVQGSDLVRSLGQYMYQRVLLHGDATWMRRSLRLRHFTITSFEPPRSGSLLEALRDVREAGGRGWDKVADVNAAFSEIRGA